MISTKRMAIIACFILFIAILIGCYILSNWLDEPTHPEIPKKSLSGKIILTSEGCCFWTTDTTISILDGSGSKTVLIAAETVFEHDIYESKNIPAVDHPIKVLIDFTSHYAIVEKVSLIAGEFASTTALLEKGLLLSFGDGDLIVRSGNHEMFFAAGCFGNEGDEAPWYQAR